MQDETPQEHQTVLPASKRHGGVRLGVDTNDNETLGDLMDDISTTGEHTSEPALPA
jgi:hypothetical protein